MGWPTVLAVPDGLVGVVARACGIAPVAGRVALVAVSAVLVASPAVALQSVVAAGAVMSQAFTAAPPKDTGGAAGNARARPRGKLATAALIADAVAGARGGSLDAVLAAREALLRDELAGTPARAAAKFIDNDAGRLALWQWRLLSRIGPEARNDSACRECLAWLLGDPAALELFLTSGDAAAGKWGEAVRVLARIQAADATAKERREGLPLRISVATALVFAEPVRWMADDTPIDPVARVASYLAWDREGVLFPSFRDLSAWELRYVVGSWSSDSDLAWARANIKPELRVRDKVGDGAHMLAYNLTNKKGVSVQEGRKFYDDKPMTMAVMLEYGGVCGAISRFGSSMSQAFGVPAMPVGQPGHCAFIWQKEPRRWSINNDISGWGESGCHGGIYIEWGHPAWLMPMMQDAQGDRAGFARAEALLAAAEIAGDPSRSGGESSRLGLLAEACKASPAHYGAWMARAKLVAKSSELKRFQSEAVQAMARHPAAFAQVLNAAPASLATAGDGSREKLAAAAIAAMAQGGADPGLASWAVLLMLEPGAKKLAEKVDVRTARAIVFGESSGRPKPGSRGGAKGGGKSDREASAAQEEVYEAVFELALDAADAMDLARMGTTPSGSARDAWRQVLRAAVRGGILQPAIREPSFQRLARGVEGLAAANRLDDARWIADRIVEAANDARGASGVGSTTSDTAADDAPDDAPDEAIKARAAQLRKSLG